MLIDRLFTAEWCPLGDADAQFRKPWAELAGIMRRNVLAHCQIFNITNVAEYLYRDVGPDGWEIKRDFPRPMPPFRSMWAEWKFPSVAKIERGKPDLEELWIHKFMCHEMGCLIRSKELENEPLLPSAKWEVRFTIFSVPLGGSMVAVMPEVIIGLDSDFMPVEADGKDVLVGFIGVQGEDLEERQRHFEKEGLINEIVKLANVPLLALSLLNCRNVHTKDVQTPAGLLKANRRRGKHVTPQHHIIEIQPMVNRIREGTRQHGYSRAGAPIIAGHFKDYRERGLFGKLKGIYWWDQRIKTNEVHEYRLKNALADLHSDWNVGPLPVQ